MYCGRPYNSSWSSLGQLLQAPCTLWSPCCSMDMTHTSELWLPYYIACSCLCTVIVHIVADPHWVSCFELHAPSGAPPCRSYDFHSTCHLVVYILWQSIKWLTLHRFICSQLRVLSGWIHFFKLNAPSGVSPFHGDASLVGAFYCLFTWVVNVASNPFLDQLLRAPCCVLSLSFAMELTH